ncbi:unnamed protein product [Caenorhabditis sp. 36 PRJEB53466]|nr:unnamed protein product [Caenorhabditis sp. 36 PRJEB53466]
MSADGLEDGEIQSEHESSPQPDDINDEIIIDKIIQKEERASRMSLTSTAAISEPRRGKSPKRQTKNFRNERNGRHSTSSNASKQRGSSPRRSAPASTWQGNSRPLRPSPSESVVFPPATAPGITLNPDIVRLQSLVSNTGTFFQPHRQQLHFFAPPPIPPPLIPSLMSQIIPPLLQSISPDPVPTYRGGNYEEVRMEITNERTTPEEPPLSPPRVTLQPPMESKKRSAPPASKTFPEKSVPAKKQKPDTLSPIAVAPAPTTAITKTVVRKEPVPCKLAPTPLKVSSTTSIASHSDKRKELRNQIDKEDLEIISTKNDMLAARDEIREISKRLEETKVSLKSNREKFLAAQARKRDLERQLDDIDNEDLDILCDESEFANISFIVNIKSETVRTPLPEPDSTPVDPQCQPTASSVEEKESMEIEKDVDEQESSSTDDSVGATMAGDSEEEPEEENERLADRVRALSHSSLLGAVINSSGDALNENLGESGLNKELNLREILIAKSKSKDNSEALTVAVTASPVVVPSERSEACRDLLLKVCKFDLNGQCTRGRDCIYLHLHEIIDKERQYQLLEGLLRDVFAYNEADIEPAINDVMQYLPTLREYEHLIQHFLHVSIVKNPEHKGRLFAFYAHGRSQN